MPSGSGLKILVVEDEAPQREMLAYNLEKSGYQVLTASDGEEGRLVALEENPALIITFRGGWCPYCNMHLSELRTVVPEIAALGVDVLFLSGDRPELLYASLAQDTQDDIADLDYRIYSDAESQAAIAFGTAFRVDDGYREWFDEKGRDYKDSSIDRDNILAVPAVYAIDQKGMIRFDFVEADYKVRLPADDLLAVAREIAP